MRNIHTWFVLSTIDLKNRDMRSEAKQLDVIFTIEQHGDSRLG